MISIIAAIGKNRELGRGNDLIWHIKEDLKNFKNLTMGKYIVMGKNTYESLPKHLEGRKYIVLSSSLSEIENGLLFNDFNKLLEFIKDVDEEVMIIGGASIYKLFLPFADKLYLTEIDSEEKADVYFPDFNKEDYECNVVSTNEVDGLKYSFVIYERK
ncbi:dihydrofolate reductase [Firmicutes bacterium CAG:460]|jgi:dihydrofolate reductase|uniref:dihydrofolate reductase n=1 Tax=Candidatus Onthocola sp. TaxID=3085646 RepID=UPI00033822D5|nr:dihydrofolate reductase [Firmicutes bacterium CAG:460]